MAVISDASIRLLGAMISAAADYHYQADLEFAIARAGAPSEHYGWQAAKRAEDLARAVRENIAYREETILMLREVTR